MKCLPGAKLAQAQGNVLHDWHAEVLAIRAFNRFVLEECRQLALGGPDMSSPFLRRRTAEEMRAPAPTAGDDGDAEDGWWHAQPFAWRDDVALHMYCSEAPCGDASMELTMAAQADAAPWDIPSLPSSPSPFPSSPLPSNSAASAEAEPTALPGRAYFSLLGAVRRQPPRGDAPATLSKSCSDKLALRQCASLLSGLAALLVGPENAYVRCLVLPEAAYSAGGCRRAFSAANPDEEEGDGGGEGGNGVAVREAKARAGEGRMRPLCGRKWGGGYAFRPFEVRTTGLEFAFSRREVSRRSAKTAASNLAVAWTAAPTSLPIPISPLRTSPTSTPPASAPTLLTPPPPASKSHSHPQAEPGPTLTSNPTSTKYPSTTNPPTSPIRAPRGLEEATLGGTLQGRKRLDARGASFATRRRMWGLAAEVADLLAVANNTGVAGMAEAGGGVAGTVGGGTEQEADVVEIQRTLVGARTYGELKECGLLAARRRAKDEVRAEALKGWVRNLGDEGFRL
ncbi:hypothetical protein DL762_007888 [Monosporascus cannonballus]|uniref:A to I editase domain-containing protein n=1 Tax=Monosporascus cannonballus TaxID=155416 RepID=A0ABY0GXU1_9PEZI|nr:hypothetical protein DL762_007888 [Monosporascus cannonballus]